MRFAFFNVKVLVAQSCPTLCDPMDCQVPLLMEFSRQESWSGLPFPSPGDLPNPGFNSGLLHCRQILYHLDTREAFLNVTEETVL